MSRKDSTTATRRTYLAGTTALLGGGLLAGCLSTGEGGDGSSESDDTTTTAGTSDASGTTETDADSDDGAGDAESYTVSMEPAGTVEFDAPPDRWIAYDGGYADMGVALGQGDGLAGIGGIDRYYTQVYEELPGVSVDRERLEAHPEVRTKEEFYAIDADVHLYDPQMLVNWFDWSEGDVAEIAENVGPFLGNLIFRRSDDWHDYRYYTL
jgi:iron complex transport system substrate-binding protein